MAAFIQPVKASFFLDRNRKKKKKKKKVEKAHTIQKFQSNATLQCSKEIRSEHIFG